MDGFTLDDVYVAEHEWRTRMAAHEERVDALIGPHLRRREAGETHAVEDFCHPPQTRPSDLNTSPTTPATEPHHHSQPSVDEA